jgi:FAD/FMN-containing dehydrogenase/Fe-S oxidoreductase
MIPRLESRESVSSEICNFFEALLGCGFEGEIAGDDATRAVLSTDNSIYQITPAAAVFPKNHQDLIRLVRAAHDLPGIEIYPRGGGTGTNAQSLGKGVVVDTSRHMNQVLEVNIEERWARVQCGVVKDHLNSMIRDHGLFFAPDLSTSNRATIGGMINTDASGQGSVKYGKTRDHVLEIKSVLLTGETFDTRVLSDVALDALPETSTEGRIGRVLRQLHDDNRDTIESTFPRLNRCLTGYDLKHIRNDSGDIDLNSVVCGSEGTLALISEAKISLEKLPTEVALFAVQYGSFMDALLDARELMSHGATSIETIDSKVLNLAMKDFVWDNVKAYFPESKKVLAGINLVEFTDFDADRLHVKIATFSQYLDQIAASGGHSFAHAIAYGSTQVNQIWTMRKRAVGLLGGVASSKKPVAFVEDTCVPPENLASFIGEFRDLLDHHELEYGMFGHVDAGVLHVRPALDLKDPKSLYLIREITDRVVDLTYKYHGLLWGEHGKGVRSEYAPLFFGQLYPTVCAVKALFDPENRLNPGKIAGPTPETSLLKIDEVPLRGQRDSLVTDELAISAGTAMTCNGNGACHNYDLDDRMCPSWKATRDRRQTPKGRAGLMREWVTRLSEADVRSLPSQSVFVQLITYPAKLVRTLQKNSGAYDFSHEVHEAMAGCLACKSCTGQCPIKVSVPTFRSQFLHAYYSRYARPLKDWIVGTLEYILPVAAQIPRVYNGVVNSSIGRTIFSWCGLVDSPELSGIDPHRAIADAGFRLASPSYLKELKESSPERFAKQVVVVQDAFTSYFETALVVDVFKVLDRLGFEPTLMPFRPNGKPLHVHGFLKWFASVGQKNAEHLWIIDKLGIPLIGVDPSMTLTYQSEYKESGIEVPNVMLMQDFLARSLKAEEISPSPSTKQYKLFAHCTEATNASESVKSWQKVFALIGQRLEIENVGCCGMAGTYGHEVAQYETSKIIYSQSWEPKIEMDIQTEILATGYSCRSQVKRFSDKLVKHPISALSEVLACA